MLDALYALLFYLFMFCTFFTGVGCSMRWLEKTSSLPLWKFTYNSKLFCFFEGTVVSLTSVVYSLFSIFIFAIFFFSTKT